MQENIGEKREQVVVLRLKLLLQKSRKGQKKLNKKKKRIKNKQLK